MRARFTACLAVALALLGFAGVQSAHAVTFHGITPRKACNTTTKIGDPYICSYQVINADDNNEDVVVTGLTDVVHSAGGNVSSGNIMGSVTWNVSGSAFCTGTPVTSCTLPNKGDAITSDDFTFYTVTAADYNANAQHILADDITVNWSEPVCVNGGCPVGGQTGTTGASTTVLNFKPTINTQLVPAGPVAIGTQVHDTSTLTNASPDAGGTVSYAVYSNNTCTTLVQALGTKTVTNGVVPNSDNWTPNAAGNFWFQASYSGDAANDPAISACTSEPITVSPNTPTINTQLVPAGPVSIGTAIHDTATLMNATANAGGSVTYAVYSANTCAQGALIQTLGTKTVTNGVVPDSDTYTPQSAGNLWFQATYSGDANNTGPVSSDCLSEPMTVNPNTPSINTQLVPAGPVAIGTQVHDTSTLVGATANAGGSVSYAVYSNNTCTTLVQALGTKTVTNGVVPNSDNWTPNAAGNFWFQATYSGDANNTGPVSSPCTSEPITVSPNTPSVNTQLVPAGPVTIGTQVHDTSTLTNATANAGGTVSYAVYSDNTCTTLVQALGTKTVTNGVVPNSDNWTPNAAGNFWFQATYSGDANNTGPVSSACTSEPITVSPNTPTVATTLVPVGPVAIGTPVHDTAQISNATANAGGTVSFAVYSNNTCTTLVQSLGTVAVVNGVPVGPSNDFTPNAAGDYYFQATYSGDVNNTGPVSSSCTSEHLVVNKNTPSINTVLVPASPVDPGTLVHDTSTLTGATANAGGTVSYAVYSNNTCTTLVQALGTKTVTNGVVPPSDNWTAGPAGANVWFQATYSGDANNAGPVKSACTDEPMHVRAPGINIVKKTNGADANDPNGADVPNIKPGDPVTWTYIVTNTGETHVPKADVHVTDNTTGVTPTFSSEQSGNGDQIFDPGEIWIYTATGTALDLTQPPPAGTHTQANACTHNNQEPGRTAYINLGTATIPGASDDDPSSYCNPPVKFTQNLTPGFWKTHRAATQALLPLKLGNHTVSTYDEAKVILSGMGCGKGADGPLNCMAGMLLAAELNLAQGGNPCIQSTLNQANALLIKYNYTGYKSYSLTSADAALAMQLHDTLSAYNQDVVITSC